MLTTCSAVADPPWPHVMCDPGDGTCKSESAHNSASQTFPVIHCLYLPAECCVRHAWSEAKLAEQLYCAVTDSPASLLCVLGRCWVTAPGSASGLPAGPLKRCAAACTHVNLVATGISTWRDMPIS